MEPPIFIVKCLDRDLSACGCEFHRVVDQVPKHLLKPDAISQDVTAFRFELSRYFQLLCCDSRACGLKRIFNDRVRIAIFQFEMKLAARYSGEIEQIIN